MTWWILTINDRRFQDRFNKQESKITLLTKVGSVFNSGEILETFEYSRCVLFYPNKQLRWLADAIPVLSPYRSVKHLITGINILAFKIIYRSMKNNIAPQCRISQA